MAVVLLSVRWVLAGVLAVAAVGKVRDPAGAAEAAAQLGVPARWSALVARLLPVAELSCAVLLVVPRTARLGGALAAALLLAFTVVIARTLAAGRHPSCHCFGAVSDEPIGAATLVRNGVLVALAVVVAAGGREAGRSVWSVAAEHGDVMVTGLSIVLLVATCAAFVLVGEHRALRQRVDALEAAVSPREGIAVGRPAPAFTLPDLDGRSWSLDELVAEKPALLVFTDAHCAPCAALLPEVADWSYAYEDVFRVAIIASGGREANLSKQDEYGLERVLLQRGDEVARAYRYRGTPAAVLVSVDGLIAEPMASGSEELCRLVARLITRAGGVRLPVGISAPPFYVHDVAGGRHIGNTALRGAMTLVVFWDDECSFCRAVDDEVRKRLPRLEGAGVVMLIASASGGGAWPATRGLLVANDAGRPVANAFGSPGTPSAVLVDANGKVASAMAVGGDELLALIDRALSMGKLAGSLPARPG